MKTPLSLSNRHAVFIDGQRNNVSDTGNLPELDLLRLLYDASNHRDSRDRYFWLFAICSLIRKEPE